MLFVVLMRHIVETFHEMEWIRFSSCPCADEFSDKHLERVLRGYAFDNYPTTTRLLVPRFTLVLRFQQDDKWPSARRVSAGQAVAWVASELKEHTIDRIMQKDDLELGLEILKGKLRL